MLLPVPPRMFPIPSYASERFLAEVELWYAAVAEVVKPRLSPAGPVVLLQVDNEAALFFRDGLFEQDYHPDAVTSTARSCAAVTATTRACGRRGRPRGLARDGGASAAAGSAAAQDLPASPRLGRVPRGAAAARAARLREAMERVGLGGVPTSHNLPPGQWAIPMSIPSLEEGIDVVGIDLYNPRWDHRTLKSRCLFLAGTARLPYSPELGGGAPPWYPQIDTDDARFLALAGLAYGLRGYNLYMAVDRDRWVGAPIDARGDSARALRRVPQLHRVFREQALHTLRRRLGALIVVPRTYMRLSRVAHAWGPLSPSVMEQLGLGPHVCCIDDAFGFAEPIQIAWVDAMRALGARSRRRACRSPTSTAMRRPSASRRRRSCACRRSRCWTRPSATSSRPPPSEVRPSCARRAGRSSTRGCAG